MRYPVKAYFTDRDGNRLKPGDILQIEDLNRALSLQQRRLIGKALPEPKPVEPEVVETPEESVEYPVPLPGGYYQLPDGSKVRGKAKALAAMKGGETDGTT